MRIKVGGEGVEKEEEMRREISELKLQIKSVAIQHGKYMYVGFFY